MLRAAEACLALGGTVFQLLGTGKRSEIEQTSTMPAVEKAWQCVPRRAASNYYSDAAGGREVDLELLS